MFKCLSDPGKARLAYAAAQVVRRQQRVHDVQKLHSKVSVADMQVRCAVCREGGWAVHAQHLVDSV